MALSTKVSILDKGEKDIFNVEYSNGRILHCNEPDLEDYDVEEGTEVICDRAFANRDKLFNIYLPDSIKAIGESVFSGCR
ncbi:MAG: leucine-rich repeat protein [Muribaculaceae bacterium]|nr:leucine-rich repeat protein [Muribaculaceae bacterium]